MENLRKPLQWSFVVTVLGCTGVFGCANEKSDVNDQNQDELNGILKDGELTALSRSALRVSPPPTGVGGAVVIMPGLGGSTGSAGAKWNRRSGPSVGTRAMKRPGLSSERPGSQECPAGPGARPGGADGLKFSRVRPIFVAAGVRPRKGETGWRTGTGKRR